GAGAVLTNGRAVDRRGCRREWRREWRRGRRHDRRWRRRGHPRGLRFWRLAERLGLRLDARGLGPRLRTPFGTRRLAAWLDDRLDRGVGHGRHGGDHRLALLLDLLEGLEELAHGLTS